LFWTRRGRCRGRTLELGRADRASQCPFMNEKAENICSQ
jgi:hypothetical protein